LLRRRHARQRVSGQNTDDADDHQQRLEDGTLSFRTHGHFCSPCFSHSCERIRYQSRSLGACFYWQKIQVDGGSTSTTGDGINRIATSVNLAAGISTTVPANSTASSSPSVATVSAEHFPTQRGPDLPEWIKPASFSLLRNINEYSIRSAAGT